jgi:hypothetical protein
MECSLSLNCKQRRTRWRMTQSAANQSPQKFSDQQGKYREFRVFRPIGPGPPVKKPTGALAFSENSLQIGTGNLDRGSGNSNSLILL